ncbi:NADH:flavin oxidoreductase/NADH oxidase [Microbacterium invictum]|uniref:2,4-dienoyl-CoA reductase-like NADH-dependent reductase (Old Yellow Enzyme family) n=1 Tax=Microbacterium invictum TaxID=515415 RepID=A0AA40SP60_9MICO|nr:MULTISPECIES: NADH:flavin oxidoreductase/NADH oxidase [Microbacterium]MBB4139695.1 2,4-dienoyl-CoA reductase-like NADH-dependent reductase (Old Yellow Enzyme family) [Microbacterium invictum]
MSLLLSPFDLGPITFRNRLWVAPMCQYSAVEGVPNDWHHVHLAQFASGGAGLVIAEATAVLPEGRISPDDTGLWNDAQQSAWAPIAASIRARGAVPGIQLAHAGRKSSTWAPFADERGSVPADRGGWQTVAPSAVAFDGLAAPVALDLAGIDAVVAAFGEAAARAVAAGFEVLEIHAAHGYLLHQFLSPLSNLRGDQYGGPLHNRARLLLRVMDAVAAAAPHATLFVRFSGTDWAEGGWDEAQTATVAGWAAERGARFFDISSGGLVAHQQITVGPGYQVPVAAQVRRLTGLPVSAVGEITDGAQAERILQAGEADAVMAGREWLRDPHFALRAATELGETDAAPWPPQYLRARPRPAHTPQAAR